MKRRHAWPILGLLTLALAVRLATAWPLRQPGYTDAYYYAVGARQLHEGHGFQEPLIWNYLDPPDRLPQPGYSYWLPLTALMGWLGLAALGDTFAALQAPFVLLSALLPLVAYGLAWDLTQKRNHALLAGLLAVFPGFYSHVLVLPDNFCPFALAGSLCLWAAGRGLRDGRPAWFAAAGLAAGLGHLARADGLLLLPVVLLAAATAAVGEQKTIQARLLDGALALAAYLLVMGPWFLRNWQVAGGPLPGAGLQTLFLTDYDQIFTYSSGPSLQGYLAWGWGAILASKAEALLLGLQRLWVENLLVFLLPFSALGLWRLHRQRLLWPFFVYTPALFGAMTLAFTFPGTRGGLYHSGGALLPFFFAAAGPGLEALLLWAARRLPGWNPRRAGPAFSAGLVVLAALLSLFALGRAGVLSGDWNERKMEYAQAGQWLAEQGAGQAVIMVGDAPAFVWHTGQPAVAVPNDPLDTILAVADRYGARYLILDASRPRPTDALYESRAEHPRLVLRRRLVLDPGQLQIYEVLP
jgi:4-amino-4-deoxy-L-arabinose transferase-like glycosyltransferase